MAQCTYGIVFTLGATQVGDVTSISFSGLSRTELDVTDLADGSKNYIMGIVDGGTVELSVNFTGTHAALFDLTAGCDSTPSTFSLDFGDAGIFSGNCYVQAISADAGVDAVLTGSISIRITGDVTYAA